MSAGPTETAVPLGTTVVLDRRTRVFDGGAVLLGGAPPRLLRLSPTAQARLVDRTLTVVDPTSAALARRLVDAGIAHPVTEPPTAIPPRSEVTIVIPVKDRPDGLARLLAALDRSVAVIVVDDGSADPASVRALADHAGAEVLRHPTARGPAAARNAGLAAATTPLVAFLDSDVVPEPGWLTPLLARFADPAVALVAPRVTALTPDGGWLNRYEAVRSSLDLGPDPALIVPRSRVAYVPSAALVVRRAAVGAGFDDALRVAEDVDLILRLHARGWRQRYEPTARVAHEHRTTLSAWWLRKAFYGTGAAPLAVRHHGAVPPLVLTPWSAAVCVLLLLGRPVAAVAALLTALGAAQRLSGKLGRVRHPRTTAVRLVALGTLGAVGQTADAVTRHYWPVAAAAALVSSRARRVVATIAVGGAVLDWWRTGPARPPLLTFVVARRLDDLAYGAGLWWGAVAQRTLEPLRPVGPTVRAAPKE